MALNDPFTLDLFSLSSGLGLGVIAFPPPAGHDHVISPATNALPFRLCLSLRSPQCPLRISISLATAGLPPRSRAG